MDIEADCECCRCPPRQIGHLAPDMNDRKEPMHDYPTRSPETLAAMERTRAAARRLETDARDVAIWLEARAPGSLVRLEIQRHHGCEDHEIAYVLPHVAERETRRKLRATAEKALQALGWTLKPEGRDVRSIFLRGAGRVLSGHQRLAAISRVEDAMNAASIGATEWPSTCGHDDAGP